MAYQATFPLSLICSVNVQEAQAAVSGPAFNLGLILGSSTAIPSYGTNPRVRQYASTNAMLSDGFTSSDPEVIAAGIVFSQAIPPALVAVGRIDTTAIQTAVPDGRVVSDGAMSSVTSPTQLTSLTADFTSADVGLPIRVKGAGAAGADLVTTIATFTDVDNVVLSSPCLTTVTAATVGIGNVGYGYAVGDVVSVVQTGASFGELRVTTATQTMVTGLAVVAGNQGTSYSVATGLTTTTTGAGTGLEVNITAVGETPVQAIGYCRAVSPSWYTFEFPEGQDEDHVNLATWASQVDQNSYYLWASTTAADITTATTDPFSLINNANVDRNFGLYTTTQNASYPNNPYAASAIMGQMMGRNTGLAGSAFSLFYKTLTGISTEPIDETALTNLTAKAGNAYISIANSFQSVWPGVGAGGKAPDEQLFIDYLVSNIQYAIGNAFSAYPKVPQTDSGQQLLITPTKQECANMQSIGFIAPSGVWTGEDIPVLGLTNGTSLPLGYKVASPLFSTQSKADRAAFKMMPIYVAFIEAGTGRSVSIQITVQR